MFVRRRARERGLVGWVANEPAGRVRCVAEGPPDAVRLLVSDLHQGPPGAFVDHVDDTWPPPTGEFARFEIRSGWHGGD